MCCHACNTPPSTVPTSVTYSHTPATHRQQCNISHAQSHACNTPPSTVPTLVTCRHTPATHRQQCNISHVQSHACNTPPPAMQHQSGTVTRMQHTAVNSANISHVQSDACNTPPSTVPTSVTYSHTPATHRRQQCQHQSPTVTRLQHTAVNSTNLTSVTYRHTQARHRQQCNITHVQSHVLPCSSSLFPRLTLSMASRLAQKSGKRLSGQPYR